MRSHTQVLCAAFGGAQRRLRRWAAVLSRVRACFARRSVSRRGALASGGPCGRTQMLGAAFGGAQRRLGL